MAAQCRRLFPVARAPDFDLVVTAGAAQPLTVLEKRHGTDPGGVVSQQLYQVPVVHGMDADGAIVAADRQMPSIW